MDVPPTNDNFKWFGEGFDGFPKNLPEDTVEYCLFVIDKKLDSIAATKARLNEILKEAKAFVNDLLKEYIWQRDAFSLRLRDSSKVSSGSEENDPAHSRHENHTSTHHLYGQTNFGDSIADEWVIVYILVELSKRHQDIWIKVSDTDGEFLLIEAASALPKWLNPDIANNRVWISNGHLRLIPIDAEHGLPQQVSLKDALHFIDTRRDELIISPFVEDAAFARIKAYPAAIQESLHHALITIPRRAAYVLHQNPTYISPAIEAFYLRDLVSLKPLQSKDLATLVLPPEDFVTTSVKFTKVNYAQLRSQVFEAPPAWTGIAPRLHDERTQMGMKLTCGFEMLLADAANKDKRLVREIKLLLEDVELGETHFPSDKDVAGWSSRQDDEKWLDIDYADFEAELSGKGQTGNKDNPPTQGAQENIRNLVERFQQFVNDDTAGPEGIASDADDDDDDGTESGISSTGEDKDGSFDEAEFEQAMKEMMGMSDQQKQDSGLLDEARKLAMDDGEADEEDVDEETQELMRRMEQELKGHGALGRRGKTAKKAQQQAKKSVMFGPEPPPGMKREAVVTEEESADEDVGPGDVELSSDDEEFNDVDLNLARNLLESFKGQAGMSGPAGNMMKALGMTMPRDEDED